MLLYTKKKYENIDDAMDVNTWQKFDDTQGAQLKPNELEEQIAIESWKKRTKLRLIFIFNGIDFHAQFGNTWNLPIVFIILTMTPKAIMYITMFAIARKNRMNRYKNKN